MKIILCSLMILLASAKAYPGQEGYGGALINGVVLVCEPFHDSAGRILLGSSSPLIRGGGGRLWVITKPIAPNAQETAVPLYISSLSLPGVYNQLWVDTTSAVHFRLEVSAQSNSLNFYFANLSANSGAITSHCVKPQMN